MQKLQNFKPQFVLDCQSQQAKLPQYDSLRDHNLKGYFSTRRMKKLLVRTGAISKVVASPKAMRNEIFQKLQQDYSQAEETKSSQTSRGNKKNFTYSPRSQSVHANSARETQEDNLKPLESTVYKELLQEFRNKVKLNQQTQEVSSEYQTKQKKSRKTKKAQYPSKKPSKKVNPNIIRGKIQETAKKESSFTKSKQDNLQNPEQSNAQQEMVKASENFS